MLATLTMANLVRVSFVIVPGFIALGMLAVVFRLYFTYYRSYLRKPKSNVGSTGYAFLILTLSQIIFTFVSILGSWMAIDKSFNWRNFLTFLAIILDIIGLRFLVYAERKRIYDPDLDEFKSPDQHK